MFIYYLVQSIHHWLKEYIKTMKPKVGLNNSNLDTCFLYRVNKLRN